GRHGWRSVRYRTWALPRLGVDRKNAKRAAGGSMALVGAALVGAFFVRADFVGAALAAKLLEQPHSRPRPLPQFSRQFPQLPQPWIHGRAPWRLAMKARQPPKLVMSRAPARA